MEPNYIDVTPGGFSDLTHYEHDLLRGLITDTEIAEMFHNCLDARNADKRADLSIGERIHRLNDESSVSGMIRTIRISLNDWARELGIGLVSISHQLIDASGKEIDFSNWKEPSIRRLKAQTDGLIAGIDIDKPRVIVGFNPGTRAEVLREAGGDMNKLTAAASPNSRELTLTRDPRQPDDKLVVMPGQMATIRAALLNPDTLRRKSAELGKEQLAFKILRDETGAHDPERYICEYMAAEIAAKLLKAA